MLARSAAIIASAAWPTIQGPPARSTTTFASRDAARNSLALGARDEVPRFPCRACVLRRTGTGLQSGVGAGAVAAARDQDSARKRRRTHRSFGGRSEASAPVRGGARQQHARRRRSGGWKTAAAIDRIERAAGRWI